MDTIVWAAITVWVILFVWGFFSERRAWNGGRCSRCATMWSYFDSDSQGGRGYVCPCGGYIWISYPGVDKDAAPEGQKGRVMARNAKRTILYTAFLFVGIFLGSSCPWRLPVWTVFLGAVAAGVLTAASVVVDRRGD